MKTLQLFWEGKEMIASDGIMYVDGRFGLNRIKSEVMNRNIRMTKNFPHMVCDSFAVYNGGQIRNGYGQIIKL
jgi:hypothetical protein